MNHLPGIYTHIVTITPAIKSKGQDYIGLGYTQHDEQFVLKPGGMIGTAEFIGAALCQVVGIPFCQPTVVTIERLGAKQAVFGSRIELGIVKFNQTDIATWQTIASKCSNLSAFSALLAIDLALGNDDRHWNNWMVQVGKTAADTDTFRLRALDFCGHGPSIIHLSTLSDIVAQILGKPPRSGICLVYLSYNQCFMMLVHLSADCLQTGCAEYFHNLQECI